MKKILSIFFFFANAQFSFENQCEFILDTTYIELINKTAAYALNYDEFETFYDLSTLLIICHKNQTQEAVVSKEKIEFLTATIIKIKNIKFNKKDFKINSKLLKQTLFAHDISLACKMLIHTAILCSNILYEP